MNKKMLLVVYSIILLFASCEHPIEYREIEIIKEVPIIEYRDVEKEVIVTEYVDKIVEVEVEKPVEIIKYVEVDKIVEVIKEIEVETIVEKEKIVEIEVVEYVDVEVPIEVEKVVVERVDNVVYTETIVYVEKEVYVMSDQEAIKEYDNYVTLNSKVLGVTDDGFEEIPLIKGLFKKGVDLYFQIDDKFYSQTDGVITEIEASDYPEIPASEYIVFENSPYKIFQFIYNGMETSRVTKYISEDMQPVTAYMQIDGACMRGNDLLYSVSESVGTRYKGVYIWTTNGNPLLIFDNGRVW